MLRENTVWRIVAATKIGPATSVNMRLGWQASSPSVSQIVTLPTLLRINALSEDAVVGKLAESLGFGKRRRGRKVGRVLNQLRAARMQRPCRPTAHTDCG